MLLKGSRTHFFIIEKFMYWTKIQENKRDNTSKMRKNHIPDMATKLYSIA